MLLGNEVVGEVIDGPILKRLMGAFLGTIIMCYSRLLCSGAKWHVYVWFAPNIQPLWLAVFLVGLIMQIAALWAVFFRTPTTSSLRCLAPSNDCVDLKLQTVKSGADFGHRFSSVDSDRYCEVTSKSDTWFVFGTYQPRYLISFVSAFWVLEIGFLSWATLERHEVWSLQSDCLLNLFLSAGCWSKRWFFHDNSL